MKASKAIRCPGAFNKWARRRTKSLSRLTMARITEWTPRILDILKQKHVPATFFAIGTNADNAPELIRREFDEGHEIGNHSYTHPDIEEISKTQIQIELNLTERLFESILGVKTILFRPPYGIDHQPETASEISYLPIPQSMGYMIIGSQIDPHDWGEGNGQAPPPAATIVQRVLDQSQQQLKTTGGNIILMHDGGGDRSQTVAALPAGDRSHARAGISVRRGLRSSGRNARRSHAASQPQRMALGAQRLVHLRAGALVPARSSRSFSSREFCSSAAAR